LLVLAVLSPDEINSTTHTTLIIINNNNTVTNNTNTYYKENSHYPLPLWWPNIDENVHTHFNPNITHPVIDEHAFIHPFAVVIGNCNIGKFVLMAPTAVCRGDEGTPIFIGYLSNIQDGVVLHGLKTTEGEKNIDNRRYSVNGDLLLGNDSRFNTGYSVFIGYNSSLAHYSLINSPAWVGNITFVGMKSIIFNAKVGNNVALGISSTLTGGVSIPDSKYVPPGTVITNQIQADSLPERIDRPYEKTNLAVVDVNTNLSEEYQKLSLQRLAEDREKQIENTMMQGN
jgi:carbonic anhydrase/acetyltransferase-like protein (isoleucine patch superfamily)